jgi:transposase
MCTARSSVLRDVRMLDRKIVDLNTRVEAEVEASGTTLTEIFGIGTILAATILGTVGDVGRFPTKAHFASYAGTAPVEASSGAVVRHRLSRWAATVSSTTPCTWSPPLRPGRTHRGATTARSWQRANPARRRCGASRGASPTPSTRALWRTCRLRCAAPLDKEEPRIIYWRTSENTPSTH